jgi:pimeloyl-ACP methyl ester carboxylesterase
MHSSAVNESGYVEIGGIHQWVQIRGDAADSPVLLFLHGGPGGSAIVAGTGWRQWERDFTIVHWDQRGAGRTFEKSGPTGGELMTIRRMADDGLQLVEFLLGRLQAPRIILVGHSWGTVIGVRMIRTKPELFGAYVGVAQVTNTRRNGALRYQRLIAWLQAQGNAEAVRRLERVGPPPYGADHSKWALFQQMTSLVPGDEIAPKMPRPLPPEIRSTDREVIGRGMAFSRQQIMGNGEFEHVDLPAVDLRFGIPIFLFSGTLDQVTPIELAEEYLGLIQAPYKELVRFEGDGHFFLFNAPERFFSELLQRVRPRALTFENRKGG